MRFEMCVTRQQFVVAGVGMAEDSDKDAMPIRFDIRLIEFGRVGERVDRNGTFSAVSERVKR